MSVAKLWWRDRPAGHNIDKLFTAATRFIRRISAVAGRLVAMRKLDNDIFANENENKNENYLQRFTVDL